MCRDCDKFVRYVLANAKKEVQFERELSNLLRVVVVLLLVSQAFQSNTVVQGNPEVFPSENPEGNPEGFPEGNPEDFSSGEEDFSADEE